MSTPFSALVVAWQDRHHPHAGGAEQHLHEVFGRLAARGIHVTLLCSAWRGAPRREHVDGIEVHRIGGRRTFAALAPWYFARVLRTRRFDVVVDVFSKLPSLTPWWPDVPPVVLLVHHLFGATAFRAADPATATVSLLGERLLSRAYRRVTTVAVSDSTARDLVRRGIAPARVVVVRNGIADDAPVVGAHDAATGRGPDDARATPEPVVVYLGRLTRYKGVAYLLRAVARVRARGARCRLVIAGAGPDRRRLERLTSRLGLEDLVTFEGYVAPARKRELLRTAAVNVIPSEREGWGLTVLEAGLHGVPTIASDSPGLRDAVLHERTGWLVPHGDAAALADRIERMLAAPRERLRVGCVAARWARLHTWDAAADRIECLLRQVAAGETPEATALVSQRPVHAVATLPRPEGGDGLFGVRHWHLRVELAAGPCEEAAECELACSAALGARDPAGHHPVLLFCDAPPTLSAVLRETPMVLDEPPPRHASAAASRAVGWLLPGWPDDPGAWIRQAVAATPGVVRVEVRAAGAADVARNGVR